MDKSPDAFRTISEVGDDLDVPQHVLRFWETRFREIKPMKRGGGRRYYRPEDVALLRGIRHLLYGEGYTIRGVQRILRDQGARFVQSVWEPGAPQPSHAAIEDEPAASTEHDVEDHAGAGDLLDPVLRGPVLRREPVKPVARGLTRDDQRQLQSALHELGECKRMLEAALIETAG